MKRKSLPILASLITQVSLFILKFKCTKQVSHFGSAPLVWDQTAKIKQTFLSLSLTKTGM